MKTTTHLPSPVKFREDINGLRAWAVMAVVLFHFQISGITGGFVGVDIFFVISGYLMTSIIVKGLEKEDFSLTQFYMARVRRILPALLVVIAVLLMLGWFWLATLEYQSLGQQSLYSLGFISNFGYYFSSGYFDSGSHEKWLLHTWSLAVEAQFYLLFPIFVSLFWKFTRSLKSLTVALAILFIMSFALNMWLVYRDPSAAFYLLPSRGWELAAGGLVFLLAKQLKLEIKLSRILNVLGWLLILGSIFLINEEMRWPGYWALFPVLGTSLVIYSQKQDFMLINSRAAQWLGDRSYSIYLWHWPLMVALYFANIHESWFWILAAITSSLLIGHLSFRFIETPTRKYLSKKSFKKEFILIVLGLVFLAIISFSIQNHEFNNRVPEGAELALNEAVNINPRHEECQNHKKWDKSPSCIYGDYPVGVLLLGDSHAGASVTALAAASQNHAKSTVQWTLTTCAPIFNLHYSPFHQFFPDYPNRCKNFTHKAFLNSLSYEKNIPIVLLGRQTPAVMGQKASLDDDIVYKPRIFFNRQYESNLNPGFQQELRDAMINTACSFKKYREVFLVRPIPEMKVNVPSQASRNIMFGLNSSEIKITLKEYKDRHRLIWWAQDEAVKACGVKILNPLPYLCDESYCYGTRNGLPLYSDDDHLSEYGNKLLIPMFEKIFK
ncbi:MAG: acyltransferase [Thiotrichales bacterium]|nr:acyltransferase [Thiotrichales bacterium]